MRLFVAVWPPAPVLSEVGRVARPAAPGLRWTTADQWHVTLRFLGEVPELGPVVNALEHATLPVADAQLAASVRRLGPSVLCVDVQGLGQLADAVTAATAAIGRRPEARRFHGHLTLARSSRRGPDLRRLSGAEIVPLRFPVRSVAVVRSHLGRAGARYETVAEVPCNEIVGDD